MKGANADPWVKIMRPPRSRRNIIIGASHHFFLTLRNCQSSESIEILLIISS